MVYLTLFLENEASRKEGEKAPRRTDRATDKVNSGEVELVSLGLWNTRYVPALGLLYWKRHALRHCTTHSLACRLVEARIDTWTHTPASYTLDA